MLSIVRKIASTSSALATSLPDLVNLSFSIPCSSQAHVLRQVFLQYRLSCFGIVSRHPTNSFPTCCDRISMAQQRTLKGLRAYLRQELSIFLLIFLHVVLRRLYNQDVNVARNHGTNLMRLHTCLISIGMTNTLHTVSNNSSLLL